MGGAPLPCENKKGEGETGQNGQATEGEGRARGTNLGRLALREVDNDSPSEVETVVLDGDKTTGLEEGEGVGGVGDNVPEVLSELLELLLALVVLSDGLLVGNDDLRAFNLGETEF